MEVESKCSRTLNIGLANEQRQKNSLPFWFRFFFRCFKLQRTWQHFGKIRCNYQTRFSNIADRGPKLDLLTIYRYSRKHNFIRRKASRAGRTHNAYGWCLGVVYCSAKRVLVTITTD